MLSNAIKFTNQNGKISFKSSENELIIEDSGIGMSADLVESILNNKNVSRAGTNNEQGAGIGLQLVVNLAEKINCKLQIESQESKGTIIKIRFE